MVKGTENKAKTNDINTILTYQTVNINLFECLLTNLNLFFAVFIERFVTMDVTTSIKPKTLAELLPGLSGE